MAEPDRCPDREILQRLLLGRLPEAEALPLGEHLLHCPCCAQAAASLPAEDGLVQALRLQGTALPARRDRVAEELISRLCQAGREQRQDQLEDPGTTPPVGALAATPVPGNTPLQLDRLLTPAQQPDELGRLGPFRVLEVLGQGGMGVVFRAEDSRLGRQVALKVLKPALLADEVCGQRFLREARAAAALTHDHIVTVHEVNTAGSVPFLVMPLLEGESLEDCLRREGRLPVAEVLRLGREIAEGLAAAHERGLIHRDVKPANIWLEGARRRAKLLDFGLACLWQTSDHFTQEGAGIGTPAYLPPECLHRPGAGRPAGPRGDLFSLGCVLYQAVTGRQPFQDQDLIATLWAVATHDPPDPRSLNPAVGQPFADLLRQLLAKDPSRRPSSARSVADRLATLKPGPAGTGRRRWGLLTTVAVGLLGLGGLLMLRFLLR